MRVTIIPKDGIVGVNGLFYAVDMTGVDPEIHAVQFDGASGRGEIEFIDKSNVNQEITNVDNFAFLLDRWNAQHDLFLNPPPPSLEEVKAMKIVEIERMRDTAVFANVTVHGRQWQVDDRSQKLLGDRISLAQAGLPLPAEWRDANNDSMAITSIADLMAIAGAAAMQSEAAYIKSWGLKEQAQSAYLAGDRAALEAIAW